MSSRNVRATQPPSKTITTFSSVSSRPTNRSFSNLVASNKVSAVRRILRDPRCTGILDLNAKVGGLEGGKTPLTTAASAGHTRILVLLLALDPLRLDVNAVDGAGNTALHCAAANGQLDAVELIVAKPGVDSGVRNKRGQTAVNLAMERLGREGGLGYGRASETKTGANIRQCLKRLWSCEKKAPSPTSTLPVHKHAQITPPETSVHARLGDPNRPRLEFRTSTEVSKIVRNENRSSTSIAFKTDIRERLQERGWKPIAKSSSMFIESDDAAALKKTANNKLQVSRTSIFTDEDVKSIEVFEVDDSGSDTDEDFRSGKIVVENEDCIITKCTVKPQIKSLWHGK